MSYTTRPLDASTWDAFAELVERNNGVFGGCWCIGFHPERHQKGISHRAAKEDRVRTDRAHAALVFDEDGAAQGWCQYGSPAELPNIKHRREYDKDAPPLPDWRITCFYVDTKHRGQGVARAALEGALDQIADAGGIPDGQSGQRASPERGGRGVAQRRRGDARPYRPRCQCRRDVGRVKVQFASRGWEDYLTWQQDRQMLGRVNALIENIRRNGHQGIGKPEQLRGNWSGIWSRRIDQEHRLVYRIVDDTVQIAQCRYRYE